jgi:flagellar L-ring protein FlgH
MINRGLLFKALFLTSILVCMIFVSGCATVKGWFGMGKSEEKQVFAIEGSPSIKFSENNYLPPTSNRQYKHMTRQKLEEESEVHAQAGSMWVMEGQGSYLFTQNKTRRDGDSLNIKIEGPAQKQIETKVSVIKKLLKQLEDDERRAKELEMIKEKNAVLAQQPTEPGATEGQQVIPPADIARAPASEKEVEKEEELKIESVPTKIIEHQADGHYRVRGQQPFMIGKREYKVIVTGMVRPEDFNDEGLSSNKLLDPQYDVVSLKRKEL